VSSVPKDVHGVGIFGNNSVTRRAEYAPPHSKGPGEKAYFLTVYALSGPVEPGVPPAQVTRDVLLAAMKGSILDSAELKVVYTRPAGKAGEDAPDEKSQGKRKSS